jgi:hypothetical protein
MRIVELYVTVNNTEVLAFAQGCFYGELVQPATIKSIYFFLLRTPYFCQILTKLGISRQMFIKVPNIQFHGNRSSGNRADTYGRRNGST